MDVSRMGDRVTCVSMDGIRETRIVLTATNRNVIVTKFGGPSSVTRQVLRNSQRIVSAHPGGIRGPAGTCLGAHTHHQHRGSPPTTRECPVRYDNGPCWIHK